MLRQAQSKDNINKLPGNTRFLVHTVFFWFCSEHTGKALRLEVEDYAESPDDRDHALAFTVTENDPSQPQLSGLPTPKYVIVNQSLPSVTQLDEWIKEQVDRRKPAWSPAARLFNSFHMLLDIQYNTWSDTPSVRLSLCTVRFCLDVVTDLVLERIIEGCPKDHESL